MPKGGNMKMPKGGKMKMPKGGKTGITKIMKKLNGDKKGMLIFNPKKECKTIISSPWLAEMNIKMIQGKLGGSLWLKPSHVG